MFHFGVKCRYCFSPPSYYIKNGVTESSAEVVDVSNSYLRGQASGPRTDKDLLRTLVLLLCLFLLFRTHSFYVDLCH